MRLTKITVTNFQGLRHAALALSEPLLLVSGGNGAGKSSLLDAISLALNASLRRVNQKKDAGQLVTDGAKGCSIEVQTTDQHYHVEITKAGKITDSAAGLEPHPALSFVLDAARFASLDGKERRRVLFELTGASAKPEVIAQRLQERGAPADKVETIKVMLAERLPRRRGAGQGTCLRGAWSLEGHHRRGLRQPESRGLGAGAPAGRRQPGRPGLSLGRTGSAGGGYRGSPADARRPQGQPGCRSQPRRAHRRATGARRVGNAPAAQAEQR